MAASRQYSSGAIRRGEQVPLRHRLRWLIRSLTAVLAVTVFVAVVWGSLQTYRSLDVAIETIVVKSSFEHVPRTEVEQIVEPLVLGGILSLDLDHIRAELENHPWVERASVSRQWPNGVTISVVEQTPVARWQGSSFLNGRGEVLNIGDNTGLSDLPLLSGLDHFEGQVMQQYRELEQMLAPAKLHISTIKQNGWGAWWLTLDSGPELIIGRDQVAEKMGRFLLVWEATLKEQVERVVQVDLRYANGVAVQWVDKIAATKKLTIMPAEAGKA